MLHVILVLLTKLIYNIANNIEEITEPYVNKQQDTEPDVNKKHYTDDIQVIQNTIR